MLFANYSQNKWTWKSEQNSNKKNHFQEELNKLKMSSHRMTRKNLKQEGNYYL